MKAKSKMPFWKKKSYTLVTLGLFILSIALHWSFGWEVFKNEQQALGEPILVGDYVKEMMRDTMENWQSEFLQLIWQVAGLSFLFHIGSPQSKESEERLEEKVDHLLEVMDPDNANRFMRSLEEKYPKK